MINILLVEDTAIVRKGIIKVLNRQTGLQVAGEADSGAAALQLLQNGLRPDVLLTDFNMPRMTGVELIAHVAGLGIKLPAIVLTMHNDKAFMDKAMAAGAMGYLMKNGDMEELAAAVKNVHNGVLTVGKEFK